MFRWLREFVRRNLIADVSPDMDLCLDCGKLECSADEFKVCARRQKRAAQIRAELSKTQIANESSEASGDTGQSLVENLPAPSQTRVGAQASRLRETNVDCRGNATEGGQRVDTPALPTDPA